MVDIGAWGIRPTRRSLAEIMHIDGVRKAGAVG